MTEEGQTQSGEKSRRLSNRTLAIIGGTAAFVCLLCTLMVIFNPSPGEEPSAEEIAAQVEGTMEARPPIVETQVIEIEVTRLVEIEVTRLQTSEAAVAEVEVTRIVEQIVTATHTATPPQSPTPSNTPTITPTPSNTPTPTPTSTPTPTPNVAQTATAAALAPLIESRGDGIYLVNIEIAPGLWHSTGDGEDCYWARRDSNQNILDNHFGNAGGSVRIQATDFEVEFNDCGIFEYLGP